jgi:hypothetical protein
LLLLPAYGHAGLIDNSASITVLDVAPSSVRSPARTSDTEIFFFKERSNVVLSSPLRVNISLPGTSPLIDGKNFSVDDVEVGTRVDSYFVHINTPTGDSLSRFQGKLTFDEKILGICVYEQTLDPSDLILGLPGTEYPLPPSGFRGLEFGFGDGAASNTIDLITLSDDRFTVEFNTRTRGLDQFRIITAVPEVSSVVQLMIAGLTSAGFVCFRRRTVA